MTSKSSQPSWIFCDELDTDEVGAGLLGLLFLLTLGDDEHANRLTGPVRKHDGAADDLVGLPGIDAEARRDFDGLVELGERQLSSRACTASSGPNFAPDGHARSRAAA